MYITLYFIFFGSRFYKCLGKASKKKALFVVFYYKGVISKYYVSLWVQNWDIIQILELNTLNCHIKGLKMSRFTRFLRVNF